MEKDEKYKLKFELRGRRGKRNRKFRRWAVEQVEKAFRGSNENYEGTLLDEVIERLIGEK